jgi:hypothetical protein
MVGASAGTVAVAAAASVVTSALGSSTAGVPMTGIAGSGVGGGAAMVARSTVGASNVTTSGFTPDVTVVGVRRVRGFGSAAVSASAGFFRTRGLVPASAVGAAAGVGAVALARAVRRVAGLTVAPLPGRIVRTGILAAGRDRVSRADASSTELLNVATWMPAA